MRTRTLLRFDPPSSGIFQVNMTFETKRRPAIVVMYPWDAFLAQIEEWERDFQHAMSVHARHADERRNVMEDSMRRAVE